MAHRPFLSPDTGTGATPDSSREDALSCLPAVFPTPVQRDEMNSGHAGGDAHSGERSGGSGAPPPRVLIVDDEASIRAALSRFFRRRGWIIDEAGNGRDGLDALLRSTESECYNVVVCDIRMPEMSGSEVHDTLIAQRPDLVERLIFITGEMTSPDVAEFIARTRRPVLLKPFELTALAEVVESVRRDRQLRGDESSESGVSENDERDEG